MGAETTEQKVRVRSTRSRELLEGSLGLAMCSDAPGLLPMTLNTCMESTSAEVFIYFYLFSDMASHYVVLGGPDSRDPLPSVAPPLSPVVGTTGEQHHA